MSKPYKTRSSEAGDVSTEPTAAENTDTPTVSQFNMEALLQQFAEIKKQIDSSSQKLDNNATSIDLLRTDFATSSENLKVSLETKIDSTISDNNARFDQLDISNQCHSMEIDQIKTELTSELTASTTKLQSEIVRIDNAIQQQKEEMLQHLNEQRRQFLVEQEDYFQRQKIETQLVIDQVQKSLSEEIDQRVHLTEIKIVQKFNDASTLINDSREETLTKIATLRQDHQQSIDSIVRTLDEQESIQHIMETELTSNKTKTEANSKHINDLTMDISNETSERYKSIDELKQAEEERMRKLELEIQRIKNISSNQSSCSSSRTTIRPDMIPKFSGNRDRLHPMTYLRSVTHLSEEILDEKNLLNIIRLTLTDRALEWYELVSTKCQTFEQFVEFFKRQYWSESHQDRLKVNLLTGHYREGMLTRENYAIDVFNKCKDIASLTEKDVAKHLLKHFELSDSSITLCAEPQTINDLIDILRKLDDLAETQKKNRASQNHCNRNPDMRPNYNQYRPPPPRYADYNPPSRGGFVNRNNGYRPPYNQGNHNGNRNNYPRNSANDDRNINHVRIGRSSRPLFSRRIQGRGRSNERSEERRHSPDRDSTEVGVQKKTPIVQVYDNPTPGSSHMQD